MAKKTQHVWGIDIGQSALKALRCRLDGENVVADAFDFIEYPKLLSQPEAEPEKLVAEALAQFASRNELRSCRVAISVPGQSGLAKFFKPPPVEVKKIPDIVKYEAKQQIPFDLNDVIWDYQEMAGSNIEDGYALESEVGLFAMKREAVVRSLKPFNVAGILVDFIQLAPLAMYNMLAYDRFSERLASEEFDPERPPKSVVLLSMGTDATDLIVTNGFRVWQRSMPLGGNHFTRQLTKDLKLTFAKAEHVKRHAMQSDDPKLVFQAMRPVFADMVTEVQRSIGFFKSLNKKADIESILLTGNSVKLPGLQPYLNKNLGFDVEAMDKFQKLTGSEILGASAFKENQLAFGVVYGLCLQLLGKGPIRTNLLPREILTERLVQAKKPWTIAAVAALLLAMVANFVFVQRSWSNVAAEKWGDAQKTAASVKKTSTTEKKADEVLIAKIRLLEQLGLEVSGNTDRRILWLELKRALSATLNRDPKLEELGDVSPTVVPYTERKDFHIKRIDSKFFDDTSKWLSETTIKRYDVETEAREIMLGLRKPTSIATATDTPVVTPPATDAASVAAEDKSGFVIELEGYHYYNGKPGEERSAHIRKYLIDALERGTVMLRDPADTPTEFSFKELGVSYPLIIEEIYDVDFRIPNPKYIQMVGAAAASGASQSGFPGAPVGDDTPAFSGQTGQGSTPTTAPGTAGATGLKFGKDDSLIDADGKIIPKDFKAPKSSFKVQFLWKPQPLTIRMQKRKAEAEKRELEKQNQAAQAAENTAVATNN